MHLKVIQQMQSQHQAPGSQAHASQDYEIPATSQGDDVLLDTIKTLAAMNLSHEQLMMLGQSLVSAGVAALFPCVGYSRPIGT